MVTERTKHNVPAENSNIVVLMEQKNALQNTKHWGTVTKQ